MAFIVRCRVNLMFLLAVYITSRHTKTVKPFFCAFPVKFAYSFSFNVVVAAVFVFLGFFSSVEVLSSVVRVILCAVSFSRLDVALPVLFSNGLIFLECLGLLSLFGVIFVFIVAVNIVFLLLPMVLVRVDMVSSSSLTVVVSSILLVAMVFLKVVIYVLFIFPPFTAPLDRYNQSSLSTLSIPASAISVSVPSWQCF